MDVSSLSSRFNSNVLGRDVPFHNLGEDSRQDFVVELIDAKSIEVTEETGCHCISTTAYVSIHRLDPKRRFSEEFSVTWWAHRTDHLQIDQADTWLILSVVPVAVIEPLP